MFLFAIFRGWPAKSFRGESCLAGKHTAWAYCHVPNEATFDMSERIKRQVERFASGFRDPILAHHATGEA
jgi:hypothetical protein